MRTRLHATNATAAPGQTLLEHAIRPKRPWRPASKAPGGSKCVQAPVPKASAEADPGPSERRAAGTRAETTKPALQAASKEELRPSAERARSYGSRADNDQTPGEESRG